MIVYLIPEPELYFYLTLALVFRQVRHSINNVSWVALFRKGIESHMSVAKPLINQQHPPFLMCNRCAVHIAQFLCWKRKLHIPHTHTYVCARFVCLFQLKLKLPIHAQLTRMGLNFSDLRGTGVSLILTPHIYKIGILSFKLF